MAKQRLTAMVVTCNEGDVLEACLKSLSWVDEILVVDLGSSDHSVVVAQRAGARVLSHKRVDAVEFIWGWAAAQAANDWVLRFDPDERFPEGLRDEVLAAIERPEVGLILLPHRYHFRGRPLSTTVWGGPRLRPVVFHRGRVELRPVVHDGIILQSPWERVDVISAHEIVHHWAASRRELRGKHDRYVGVEGASRHRAGETWTLSSAVGRTVWAFLRSFVRRGGWRGGLDGWYLSGAYANYEWRAQLALRRHQRSLARQEPEGP